MVFSLHRHTTTKAQNEMFAKDIQEMMDNWNKTEAAVRAAYPNATDEQVFQISSAAMKKSLGL
jgi:hypothetical protein